MLRISIFLGIAKLKQRYIAIGINDRRRKKYIYSATFGFAPTAKMFHVDVLNFSTEHVAYMPISYYVLQ